MKQLDERTMANLDVVLEHACRRLSASGGDHQSRKFVATRLVQAARTGARPLGALEPVALEALEELTRRGKRPGDARGDAPEPRHAQPGADRPADGTSLHADGS